MDKSNLLTVAFTAKFSNNNWSVEKFYKTPADSGKVTIFAFPGMYASRAFTAKIEILDKSKFPSGVVNCAKYFTLDAKTYVGENGGKSYLYPQNISFFEPDGTLDVAFLQADLFSPTELADVGNLMLRRASKDFKIDICITIPCI